MHRERNNGDGPGMVFTAIYGGIAGAASVLGNTPIDVVKTRMQVNRENIGIVIINTCTMQCEPHFYNPLLIKICIRIFIFGLQTGILLKAQG